jgi:hypothetical protein
MGNPKWLAFPMKLAYICKNQAAREHNLFNVVRNKTRFLAQLESWQIAPDESRRE